jgi:hypothetical protein
MASAVKLQINASYNVYSLLNTISGEKLKVVGIMNYEEAKDLPYSINVLAINEKVISLESEVDTEKYMKTQLYYYCKGLEDETKIFILWDEIIDANRTTKLTVDYTYSLILAVKETFSGSIEDVITNLRLLLGEKYANDIEASFIQVSVTGQDEKEQLLADYKQILNEAMAVAQKLASVKQIETAIDEFVKGRFNERLASLSDQISTLNEAVSTIAAQIL